MKHVGFNVAADPTYSVSYMGVNGGLVIVVADDPGLYSSQNEQDTRMVARAAKLPVLEPSDSAEAKEFMKLAFELSEKFDRPFVYRTTTRLAHSQGVVELEERTDVEDKAYVKDIRKNVMMPEMQSFAMWKSKSGIRNLQKRQIHFQSTESKCVIQR